MTHNRVPVPLRRLVATLAIAWLAVLAGATPAAAAPDGAAGLLAGCPANTVCIYVDKDFNGPVFEVPAGQSFPNLHLFACPCDSPKHGAGDGNFGDQMSAWVNNTSMVYCWYYDINYGRFVGTMSAGSALTWLGTRAQDEASSIRPC
jgi:hypothetical protein